VIVKVVNAGDAPVDMAINLRGVTRVAPSGTAIVLAGEPSAMNSIEEPRKVAPVQETVANTAPSFHRTFPPHSLTILRLKASLPSGDAAQSSR
jgi:alpha-L-arabinofuranosidase